MDPASNETPGGLQLPAPQAPATGQPVPPMTLPLPPAMPQVATPVGPTTGGVPVPGPQPGQGAQPGQPRTEEPLPVATAPIVDDGGDLIEKEWVNRAKQIVGRTRDDPYKQSEELTAFRADYMKKHFGKDIKLK